MRDFYSKFSCPTKMAVYWRYHLIGLCTICFLWRILCGVTMKDGNVIPPICMLETRTLKLIQHFSGSIICCSGMSDSNIATDNGLVHACTSSPRRYSLASRYRLAPACQGIAPRWAGRSLYPRGKELFLAKQIKSCTGLPRNNSLASCYKLLPARQ
jgi:hypothetical protein